MPSITESIVLCNSIRPDIDLTSNSLIITAAPQSAFYVLQRDYHQPQVRSGIHPTAIINENAIISPSAYVGPYCVIGHATVGPGCVLESHVVLRDDVVLHADVTVESHSTIGATGVAWAWNQFNNEKIIQPQTGGVDIGNGTFIGTDVTIVRGSINELTVIGANCLIAHGTKIGHGCQISNLVHFANNVTIAGSVTIGRESFLSSGCVIRPNISLPRGTTVGAGAVVVSSPENEGTTVVGVPAKVIGQSGEHMAGIPNRNL